MRRGHGSTKVPGVKLRPAPKATGQRLLDDLDDASASETTQSGSVSQLNAYGPLAGVVVCATGIANKTQLFTQAKQLGAASSTHFTNLTTHLVAEAPGSAKYLCALERGVPIVSPDWIRDVHATWRDGGEVDIEESVKQHRLRVFTGVKLCLTGFDDLQERLKIHQLVAKDGGVYSKGFEPSVTHLVCQTDKSDKIAAARKLNQSRSLDNKIHVIWEEWFWDCLEYGGMWACDNYSLDNPRPQRKPPRQAAAAPSVPKAAAAPLPPSVKNDLLIRPDDPAELGHVKQIPGISNQIWQSIVRRRSSVVDGQVRIGTGEVLNPLEQISGRGAVISRVSSAKAAALHAEVKPSATSRQPFARVASMAAVAGPSRAPLQAAGSLASIPTTSSHSVFTGKRFFALGDARCDALETAVNDNGGRWLRQNADVGEADFVLVRLCESAKFWQEHSEDDELRARMRTECWVEKCLYEERVCDADEHLTFVPLHTSGPLPDAEKLSICFSGVDAAEACWLKRLIRAVGATYSANFTRKCTQLVCDSGDGAKCDRARDWGVPVVQRSWLFDLAAELNGPASAKGETMADITNASDSRSQSAAFASLGFDSISTGVDAGSTSFGAPSLLMPKAEKIAAPPSESSPLRPSSCTPSPMRFPSPRPTIHASESAPATLGSAKGTKRTRSDDSSSKSAKRARPVGRTKVAIDRASSVVSVRSVSTPVPQAEADAQDEPEESMLITYHDEAGEKERQRLMRMFSAPPIAVAEPAEESDSAAPLPAKKATVKPKAKPAGRRRVGGF